MPRGGKLSRDAGRRSRGEPRPELRRASAVAAEVVGARVTSADMTLPEVPLSLGGEAVIVAEREVPWATATVMDCCSGACSRKRLPPFSPATRSAKSLAPAGQTAGESSPGLEPTSELRVSDLREPAGE